MQAKKKHVFILIILLVAIISESSLLKGTEERDTAKDINYMRFNPGFKPHLGTSYYSFELNGVDIGTGWISMEREGNIYKIHYEAKTNDTVDYICKARYRGEGIMEADPLKPVSATLHQRVRSKTKEITIYFERNGRVITTETKREEGKDPESEVRKTRADGLVLDPLSAVFLMQGIDWEMGKEMVLEVFTGKAHYEARFICVDKVDLESSGIKKIVWVINQVSRNLDKEPEEQPEKKNPWLKIYVSANGYPDVLKVETTRKIGHIIFKLDRFEPAPEQTLR